jgi:hypothetical protein
MKWLTLNEIKDQLRIERDFTLEDDKLTGYGESAEEVILEICNRTYDDFIDNYGCIPKPIWEASLLLVNLSYQQGTAASTQQMYAIPYAFDMKVLPYMRFGTNTDAVPVQVVTLGSDAKIAFTVDLPDDLKLSDVDFTGKVYNAMKKDVKMDFTKADCIMIDDGVAYVVLVDTDTLGIGTYLLKVTVHIPDTDYPTGYRKEVININPHVSVRG